MKTKICLLAGLVALLAAGVASRLSAQQPAGAMPSTTKVAVVNLVTVLSKYEKAKTFKNEIEQLMVPIKAEADKLKKDMMAWEEALRSGKVVDTKLREQYEQAIIHNKRKLEDLAKKVQKDMAKKNEDQIVQLYKEVNTAVKGYAASNGIQLVLAYGEPTEGDLFAFPNISRKIQGMEQAGSMVPMFASDSIDISTAVANSLNQAYASQGGRPVSAAPVSLPKQ